MGKKIAKLNKPLVNRIIGHGEEQVDQLLANPLNFRLHPDNQQQALAGAIDDIGFIRSVTVNQRTGRVVDGHLRVTLAARSGVESLPVEYVDLSEAEEAQALLSLDPIAAMAASDKAKLDELMRAVQSDDERVQAMISEIAEREGLEYAGGDKQAEAHRKLSEQFIVPPFTVLDARQGYWQERKRAWIALGIKGELGRGEVQKSLKSAWGVKTGKQRDDAETWVSTSIFDPVLCELTYRWFCTNGGRILDPFAGEATKGIVASYLGYEYTGIELRKEQIEANGQQAGEIGVMPKWICGDSANLSSLIPDGEMYDLIFTSPPYYDLEIYSESQKDGSAFETYEKFIAWYEDIFKQAVAHLKDNRFLVVKIEEVRDKKTGVYRNFLGDNISCFIRCGLSYYNEAVLVTAIGTLPVRVGKQFRAARKLGKTHQNILIFYKGDPRTIGQEFSSEIQIGEPQPETD